MSSEADQLERHVTGLPDGWHEVRLGDVSRSFAGGTPSRSNPAYYGPGIPWLKSGEVRAGRISAVEEEITDLGLRESSARVAKAGSPVIAMYGATAGVAGILEIDAALNQAVLAIEPVAARLDREYCFHMLSAEAPRLLTMTQGSGQPNLSKGLIDGLRVALPSLNEQRRIAEMLRSMDDAIATAQDVIVQLREVRSHRLDAFMALPGAYKRIEEVCRLSGGNGFPIKHQGKSSGRYPFAKVSDMNRPGNEVLMRHAENYVDDADLRALKAKTFPVGTTFFPKVGATLLTNKRRISAVEMLVDNNVMGAVAAGINPWFLYYAFCTIDMADYVQPGAVPSVNQRTIGQIMIPVPSKSEQERFAQAMRDLDLAIEAQAYALGQLRQSKAMIAADLLSGQVRVPA